MNRSKGDVLHSTEIYPALLYKRQSMRVSNERKIRTVNNCWTDKVVDNMDIRVTSRTGGRRWFSMLRDEDINKIRENKPP